MSEVENARPFSWCSWWVHVLPIMHLLACCTVLLTYVVPALRNVEGDWEPIIIADFPISVVGIGLAFGNHWILFCGWYVVVGTLWWYFLSFAAFILVRGARKWFASRTKRA